ncbi:MAG: ABC transporter ATP-binding protein, partial [Candidatus Rokubacteria bacterium]|nr:ABC transporter ATP-binding protein [Candidatus Rokubacteria bacterium]
GSGEVQVLSTRRPRIVIRGLAKTFREGGREVPAVHDVSFEVLDKEFVAIVGPSGCGKSTILNMIGGLVAPSAGTVELDGRPVAGVPPRVGYVFQKDTVFPWRTVARNLALGLEYRGLPRAQLEGRVREGIRLAGLQGFEDAFPATLSGGMRQRVALMRTLVVEPEILLMDEPFAAVDAITREVMQEELLRILQARPMTVVFVTHSIDEALLLGDRVAVMSARPGRVREVLQVPFPRPRAPRGLRAAPEYLALRERIWDLLSDGRGG